MIVLRIENGLPHVQLNLGERNLNAEIRAILPQPSVSTTTTILQKLDDEQVNFNSNKPEMNIFETHSVQLTRVDADSEGFHVVSMRDNLPTIMSALNDWDVEKQPLIIEPKPNMLICPQYQDTTEEKRLRKSPEKDESSISHQSHPSENIHAEVKFMDERISYTTIGSDGILSCTFLLVIGRIDDNEFAFLSHYPEPYEPPFTPITVLVDLIDKLSERMTEAIGKCPPPNMTKKKKIDEFKFTNMKILVGGAAMENEDLVRDGFSLLNHNNNNNEHLFTDLSSRLIYQQLKLNAIILKPITFTLNDSDESRGYVSELDVNEAFHHEDKDEVEDDRLIPDEPGLSLIYDCATKTANVCMEWIGDSIECVMASLSIDFSKIDWTSCSWEWHNNDILSTIENLQSDKKQLALFNGTLKFAKETIFVDGWCVEYIHLTISQIAEDVRNSNKTCWFTSRIFRCFILTCSLQYSSDYEYARLEVQAAQLKEPIRLPEDNPPPRVYLSVADRRILDWHMANLEFPNAAPLNCLSLKYWDQRVEVNVKNGEDSKNDMIETYRAEVVLVTVPLGVLQENIIVFDPQLLPEDKQSVFENFGFGNKTKVKFIGFYSLWIKKKLIYVVLSFDKIFWDPNPTLFAHVNASTSSRGELFLFWCFTKLPVLIVLIAGETANIVEYATDDVIIDRTLIVLRNIFGSVTVSLVMFKM
ncbi:unnamed protein product [Rotaria socialis]|uniref:Amine oxidase domain-containing protein n=1 Tax=Rotaria socialis TaxID=392032 RepID=A0A817TJP3_9BILA|nr:unnamed protein product [Rotaria socialis]